MLDQFTAFLHIAQGAERDGGRADRTTRQGTGEDRRVVEASGGESCGWIDGLTLPADGASRRSASPLKRALCVFESTDLE
jgi:hypothetical protein